MFTNDIANRKIADILNKEGGSDADYIRDLQTLVTLKNAAEEQNGRGMDGTD